MARASVLIIDPDGELTKIVGSFLNSQGLRANATTRVRDAVTKLALEKYAAILLEPDLGFEHGEDVIRAAREGGGLNSKTPFIVATRSAHYELPTDVVPNIQSILIKPFRFEDLLGALKLTGAVTK